MAGAVLAAMLLTLLLPSELRLGPRWLLPILEGALLVVLIVGDPGRISPSVHRCYEGPRSPS
jgi:hypothetical protein